MTRKSNRGPDPSELTLRMLCANAAGRCQFEGCNKPVFFDGLTLREFNKSNVAHIVSSSSSGPRGDVLRSHQLSDKLCNLMLLCPDHHKLIDDFPNSYPEADLLEMKRKHEEAIATQCGLIYKEPSEVLMVSSPIKGRTPVTVNFNQCADAVMPEKRVASVRGQRIKVEIEGLSFSRLLGKCGPCIKSQIWLNCKRYFGRRSKCTLFGIPACPHAIDYEARLYDW